MFDYPQAATRRAALDNGALRQLASRHSHQYRSATSLPERSASMTDVTIPLPSMKSSGFPT